ncbi:MAG: hypothetical protein J5I50_08090 [Chitinophagaceae bacterium]|nr:hypothetical protein [Chitinophagaceae bacterium]
MVKTQKPWDRDRDNYRYEFAIVTDKEVNGNTGYKPVCVKYVNDVKSSSKRIIEVHGKYILIERSFSAPLSKEDCERIIEGFKSQPANHRLGEVLVQDQEFRGLVQEAYKKIGDHSFNETLLALKSCYETLSNYFFDELPAKEVQDARSLIDFCTKLSQEFKNEKRVVEGFLYFK